MWSAVIIDLYSLENFMKISKKPSKIENSFPKGESNSQTPGYQSDILVTTPPKQVQYLENNIKV